MNAEDPTPLYTGSQVNLQLGLTSSAPPQPVLTWATLPGAENIVLYKDEAGSASWLTLTNFTVSTNAVSVVDTTASGSSRLYRVQVNP